jgi:hypothetical protein
VKDFISKIMKLIQDYTAPRLVTNLFFGNNPFFPRMAGDDDAMKAWLEAGSTENETWGVTHRGSIWV